MPSAFGLRIHTFPDTDGNAPTGAVRKTRDIAGHVQPERLSFVSSAAASPRPGRKRIEIWTPERSIRFEPMTEPSRARVEQSRLADR